MSKAIKRPRVAVFTRVSLANGRQSNDRQVSELKDLAKQRGWDVVMTSVEKISGTKDNASRGELSKVFNAAETGTIDKVVVSEVTRLGRDTSEVLIALKRLHKCKVSVFVMNYNIETLNADGSLNNIAQFIFTMLADIGRMEKATLIERINSGLKEAKRKGVTLGRKRGSVKSDSRVLREYPRLAKLLQQGLTVREAADASKKSWGTVMKVKKALERTREVA